MGDPSGGIQMARHFKQLEAFNGEELLFINRIAFYLFCEYGPGLKFSTFANKLKEL
jgi:hypothetical protein